MSTLIAPGPEGFFSQNFVDENCHRLILFTSVLLWKKVTLLGVEQLGSFANLLKRQEKAKAKKKEPGF